MVCDERKFFKFEGPRTLENAFPGLKNSRSCKVQNFRNKYTVKPLYSGHHRDREKVSAIERCPLHRGFSQICLFGFKNNYFTAKTCYGVPGYCGIDTMVVNSGGRMRLKT